MDKAGNLYSGIRSWAILNYSIITLKENETYVFMLPCLVQKKPWLPTTQKKESLFCFVLFYHAPILNIFGVKKVKIKKKKKKNLLAKFPGTKIIYGLPWV